MAKITDITKIETKKDRLGRPYKRTHAIMDDGTEAVGYSDDFKIGDKVEVFFDQQWNIIKFQKTLRKDTP